MAPRASWLAPLILSSALCAGLQVCASAPAQGGSTYGDALTVPRASGPYPTGTYVTAVQEDRHVSFAPPGMPRVLRVQVWYPSVARTSKRAAPYLEWPVAREIAREAGLVASELAGVRTNSGMSASPARGRFPVVVFSPGYGAPSALYTGLLEDLSSRGFVVVGVDHTYETSIVRLPSGAVVHATLPHDAPSGPSAIRAVISARDGDIALIRHRLGAIVGRLRGTVERGKLGVFGHSLGGLISARAIADGGFDCGADLDGSVFGVRKRSSRPFMVLSESARDGSLRRFWNRLDGERFWFLIHGTRHLDFTDWAWLYPRVRHGSKSPVANLLGSISGVRAQTIERTYVGAFFSSCLLGRNEPLLRSEPSPFSAVSAEK